MGINFRKRIKLGKFANLNLGKTGAGLSFGIPGARLSVNSKGRTQATLGIPGTGLSYTKVLGTKKTKKKVAKALDNSEQPALESYEEALYALSHIHTEAADFINFNGPTIRYQTREVGPLQQQALEDLESYKPSFFDNLLKRDKTNELKQKIYDAIEADNKNREWHTLDKSFQEALMNKEPQAFNQFLEQNNAFDVFDDDCESYSLEFDIEEDVVNGLLITIHTNIQEDVLNQVVTQNSNGAIRTKKLSIADFNERSLAYISSLVLGFVKEALAFLPLEEIHVNVNDHNLNANTGLADQKNIVAAEFTREHLGKLNFDTINPIEVFTQGAIDIDFDKRKGWGEVELIEVD